MPIEVAIQWMTVFEASNIQFQACQEQHFWHTRFQPDGSLWGDEFLVLICQEHVWQIKWVLATGSPQWQQQ
jgi:hypothetical protein